MLKVPLLELSPHPTIGEAFFKADFLYKGLHLYLSNETPFNLEPFDIIPI